MTKGFDPLSVALSAGSTEDGAIGFGEFRRHIFIDTETGFKDLAWGLSPLFLHWNVRR